jgi:Asp-tRNA(Asn)/Glu-tRNA(Gln) amidotransferase A subunit family amidase
VGHDVRLDLGEHWTLEPIERPRIAFVKSPVWEQATPPAKEAFAGLVRTWGDLVREVELPPLFDSAHEWHRTIMEADMAASYEAEYAGGKERLSAMLREMIERGQRTTAVAYSRAQDGRLALCRELGRFFVDFDAIVTPGTQGVAPLGLAATGSPMFCTIWSLCGVPALSLPMLSGEEGLPIGAQLVGPRRQDARLLRIAHWLVQRQRAAAGVTA